MDILLVSGLDFTKADACMPQLGQEILKSILDPKYAVELISFDNLNLRGKLTYEPDIAATLDKLTDYLLSFHARVIGFYTICNSFLTAVELARRVKSGDPGVKLVFGGPHASVTASECLKAFPFVDVICRGESELSITPLMDALLNDGNPACDDALAKVPGISYRNGSEIVSTPACALVPDSELSNYTVFDHGSDAPFSDGHIPLEGGRGCPFGCTFCSTSPFWGRKFRIKPVEALLHEMHRFNELYGANCFHIQHDIFTASRAHLKRFCESLLADGSGYKWRCSSRADVLDAEMIGLMARSGCEQVYVGVETGSPRMQKLLKKNLDPDAAFERILELARAKIFVTVSFIYGFADETEDDLLMTLHMIEKLYLSGVRSVQLHRFFPLPATEEAAKVADSAYYDENDVDLSIFNRKAINDEGRALIRENKELFLQFYTFPSVTRQKYPYIEAAVLFMAEISDQCYNTGKYLVNSLGIAGLYRRYEAMFYDIYLAYSEMSFSNTVGERSLECLEQIVHDENSIELSELFRYEHELFAYLQSGSTESVVHNYAVDVTRSIGSIEAQPTTLLFWHDKNTGAACVNVVPDGIELY